MNEFLLAVWLEASWGADQNARADFLVARGLFPVIETRAEWFGRRFIAEVCQVAQMEGWN